MIENFPQWPHASTWTADALGVRTGRGPPRPAGLSRSSRQVDAHDGLVAGYGRLQSGPEGPGFRRAIFLAVWGARAAGGTVHWEFGGRPHAPDAGRWACREADGNKSDRKEGREKKTKRCNTSGPLLKEAHIFPPSGNGTSGIGPSVFLLPSAARGGVVPLPGPPAHPPTRPMRAVERNGTASGQVPLLTP